MSERYPDVAMLFMVAVGLTYWKIYLEQGTTLAGIVLDNSALVFSNDLMADIEPQTCSLPHRLGSKERLENILLNGRIDTGTTISTGENNLIHIFLIPR